MRQATERRYKRSVEEIRAMRATLHMMMRPELFVPPTRTFIYDAPYAADGHRHEYGFKTLICENPLAPNCGRRGPVEIFRMDKVRNRMRAVFRERFALNMELDYPERLPDNWRDEQPWWR